MLRRLVAQVPRVCVVDELAHSNAPGSERQKRWQDVEVLLQAGIDVLTTMNVQGTGEPERSNLAAYRVAGA